MSKAKHKQKPEPTLWWLLDNDYCYKCKNQNNCNYCKRLKEFKKGRLYEKHIQEE